MQERIVLWGNAGSPEKDILLAIALRLEDRVVDLFMFDKQTLPSGFVTEMQKKWQEGEDITFPEGVEHRVQPLTDQSLLPTDVRVEKPESIRKIQNEWAYEILALKTYESFKKEIEGINEQVANATEYNNALWEQTKSIWDRALRLRNDNMMRKQYAEEIKDAVNVIFDKLKTQRDENSKHLEQQSTVLLVEFREQLGVISKKIEEGKNLQESFNELRQFQEKIKNARMVIAHRKELWNMIDTQFEAIKGRRSQGQISQLQGRVNGLKSVVEKMEKGLARDKQDLVFQNKRNNDKASSQLEMQLRKAKIQVLEDTIKSKEEKLADIYKTIAELESKGEKFAKKQQSKEVKTTEVANEKKGTEEVIEHINATTTTNESETEVASVSNEGTETKETSIEPTSDTAEEIQA